MAMNVDHINNNTMLALSTYHALSDIYNMLNIFMTRKLNMGVIVNKHLL